MPPRSSLRQRTATPARSTRATTVALQDTPGTRRSARAASRQPITTQDVVSNPALPEIQTQQSYAYGSSKTPALPEQLTARDMSMRAVAHRLDDAADEAERNLEAHAAAVRGSTPESQILGRDNRAQRRASKEPSRPPRSPPSQTPDNVRKQYRVAAWVDDSQLDDIPEESSRQQTPDRGPETPARRREESEASSFPSGSYDHSYNYERGEREPRLPRPEAQPGPASRSAPHLEARRSLQPERQPQSRPEPQRLARQTTSIHSRATTKIRHVAKTTKESILYAARAIWQWVSRMAQTLQKCFLELPDTPAVSALFKSLIVLAIVSACSLLFCAAFTYTCDSGSASIVSQYLQTFCGRCTHSPDLSPADWDFPTANSSDTIKLHSALQRTLNRIDQIEQRLSSKIESTQASLVSDASKLRVQQSLLESQIERLNQHQPSHDTHISSSDVPSPLIPKINFFSPNSGAVIIPHLTSPTRARRDSFLFEVAKRALNIRYELSAPPATALEPWSDEGECWCAAETPSNTESMRNRNIESTEGKVDHQDSIRLAIQTGQQIYPTELIVEHFPSSGSLEPGTAPRDVELWADFSNLSYTEWEKLHIKDLISESSSQNFLPAVNGDEARTWARIGTATYATSATPKNQEAETYEIHADEPFSGRRTATKKENARNHVQRFNLSINQNGLLHYSDRFLVRVRNNHGAPYTCLYRVRLHGLPLDYEDRE